MYIHTHKNFGIQSKLKAEHLIQLCHCVANIELY